MLADLDTMFVRATLAKDGAVFVPGLLDAEWCERLRGAIDRCRAEPGPHYGVLSKPDRPRVDSDLFRWGDDVDLRSITHDSPVTALAAAVFDVDEVVLVEDQWFASEPGPTTPSPWHHDEPYYRLDRPFLTIWIALDAVGDDGALRVVPGSHLDGELYAPVEFSASSATVGSDGAALLNVPDIDADPERHGVRSWPVAAGDAIALDSRTLHATGRVVLDGPFRRLSTRWAHPETRYRLRPSSTATFWDLIDHGLVEGDRLGGPAFPTIPAPRNPVH